MAYNFYFLDDRTLSPLEIFFSNVKAKIELSEQHLTGTAALYNEGYSKLVNQIEKDFTPALHQANTEYDAIAPKNEEEERYAMHQSGLDQLSQLKDEELEYTFNQFAEMKDHFNKASVVGLYSLLEGELRYLCDLLKVQFTKKIGLEHLGQNDYLKSIELYLSLVIELDTESLTSHLSKFKDIQFLRNRIVHNTAEFPTAEKNENLERIRNQANGKLHLLHSSKPGFVVLRIDDINYLVQYYQLAKILFNDILWSIEKKSEFKILKARLSHLFGYIVSDVNTLLISIGGVTTISGGTKIIFEVTSSDTNNSFYLKCTIVIEPAKEFNYNAIDQTDDTIASLPKLLNYLQAYPRQLSEGTLRLFLPTAGPCKITMTYYY